MHVHLAHLPGAYTASLTSFKLASGDSTTVNISFAPTALRDYNGLALDVFSIPDEMQEDMIWIYPNPASDILNIQFSDNAKSSEGLRIYNMMGELTRMYDHNIQQSDIITLNIFDLPQGIYFLEVDVEI